MHRHELSVLNALKEPKRLSLSALLDSTGLGRDEAMWAVENLAASKFVTVTKEERYEVKLSGEGEDYAKSELPEQALVKKLGLKPMEIGSLSSKTDQIAFIWAKKKGLVAIEGKMLKLTDAGRKAAKSGLETDKILKRLHKDASAYSDYKGSDALQELEKRGLMETKSKEEVKEIEITQQGVLQIAKERQSDDTIDALDRRMIKNRSWAGKKFKAYNVNAPVEPADVAARHPLRRTIDDIREAYVSLGFQEVSGPIIEPAFRVFDYLFVPQDHPARDVQDTFFLGRPKEFAIGDEKLVERIKREHEKAWRGEWSEKIAMQAVARTHTTSVTGRYIDEIVNKINAGEKYELPVKLFTIGRNLRNETVDPMHTTDFYQHDGIIIGKNLTLSNLFDTLLKLYKTLGMGNLRFKPMYYPFVEPGVQMLGKLDDSWVELGGAGIIRKEITGVERSSINVLAWGPAGERILLVKKKVKNIAELYGSSVGWLRDMRMV